MIGLTTMVLLLTEGTCRTVLMEIIAVCSLSENHSHMQHAKRQCNFAGIAQTLLYLYLSEVAAV
jgi:hypothetical protein